MDYKKALAEAAKNMSTVEEVQDFLKEITGGIIEKILQEELKHTLGYKKHDPKGKNTGNSRNGSRGKKVMSSQGELEIQIPRDRNGEYTPEIIKPYQNDISAFDKKIISMYARGMTTRDIQAHVYEIYGANYPLLWSQ